jgi:hypothetical protein
VSSESSCKFANSKECTGDGSRDAPSQGHGASAGSISRKERQRTQNGATSPGDCEAEKKVARRQNSTRIRQCGSTEVGAAVHQPGPRPRRVRAQKKQNPKTPRSVYTLLDYLFSHDETPKITAWVAAQVARAAWVCELGMPTDHEHDKYMEDGTDTQRTRITASCTAYAYFRFSLRSESRVDSSVAAGSVSHHA